MSEASPSFEATLDELERARTQAELDWRDRLAELDDRVRAVSRQVNALGEQVATGDTRAPQLLSSVNATAEALAEVDVETAGTTVAWPQGEHFLRRALNRVVRWFLRDYLEALDRRTDARVETERRVQEAVSGLRDATADLARVLVERDASIHSELLGAQRDVVSTRESFLVAFQHAVEALAALVGVQEGLQLLMDAKDAETLQRAAHGPLRRMELVFEEIGRQQEAMIADLVGRRQELDRLVEIARGGEKRE